MRAGALWRVEREIVGGGVTITDTCCRAHQALGEIFDGIGVLVENHDETFALFHGYQDAFLKTFVRGVRNPRSLRFDLHLVDYYLNVVVLVAVNLHASDNLFDLSVYTNVQIAFATHRFEQFAIMTFSAAYQWGKNEDALSLIVVENHVDHLLLCIFHHFLAGHIAVGLSGTGIEETQIVVDLSGSAYGRTGIAVGGLLFDADDGGETGNLVDIRSFHAPKEIAGIGREGFNIASLTFGEDGVESQ